MCAEGTLAMAGLRSIYKHWQVEHDDARRRHEQQDLLRFRQILGAYGLDVFPQAEPSNLNDSLLVAWLAADDPQRPS